MEDKKTDDIKSRVTTWIQGKHGLIGIIPPMKKTTEEEWDKFYNMMAEIAVKNSIIKGEEEAG